MISVCNKTTANKIVVVSENKRKFIIKNNSLYTINEVKVDGCYIKVGLKCDFLFELSKETIEKVFYVELKGSDVTHGIEQLESTINTCKAIHSQLYKECYIVASKVPSSGTSSQVLKKQFIKKNKIQLFIDTKIKEVKV
jgi:hypothetical protein